MWYTLDIGGSMKKPLLISAVLGVALTAVSIILLVPQDGDDLETALEYEAEHIKEIVLDEKMDDN